MLNLLIEKYRGRLTGILALVLAVEGACLLVPWQLGKYIDALIARENAKEIFLWLCGIALLAFLLEQTLTLCCVHLARNWEKRMRGEIFQCYCSLQPFVAEQFPQGAAGMKFMRDVPLLGGILRDCLPAFMRAALASILALGACFRQCWQLGCVVACLVPFLVMMQAIFKNRFNSVNQRQRIVQDIACSRIFEFLNVFPELRAMNAEAPLSAKLKGSLEALTHNDLDQDQCGLAFQRCLAFFLLVGEYLVLGVAGWYAMQGRLPVGQVVFFQVLIMRVLNSCSGVLRLFPQWTQGKEAARSLFELFDKQPCKLFSEKNFEDSIKTLDLQCVSFCYPNTSRQILDKADFHLEAGEMIALTGVNGAGKTTLWKIMTGFIQPDSGNIFVNDDISLENCLSSFRKRIAFVTQRPFLLYGTLKYNITLGEENEEALQWALKWAGFDVILQRFPSGLEQKLEDGANLSGGECQRLALARALFRRPEILVLDEITNHLDGEGKKTIMALLQELKGKIILLVISHDNDVRRLCDRELHLQ